MKDIFDDFDDDMSVIIEDARYRTEAIIDIWLDKMKYTDSVAYNRHIGSRTLEIYAYRPGILIGKGGRGVDELVKMLNEEFGGEWHVKFMEIHGGFVNSQKRDV